MEGFVKKEEACPQLLDLIPRNKEWVGSRDQHHHHGSSEERKLELRLGPPGEDWSMKPSNGYFTSMSNVHGNGKQNQTQKFSSISDQNPFLQFPSMAKESSQSQTCCTKVAADFQESAAEKKAFSISSSVAANTAVPNKTSQKRTAPAPVVGWPPIRSFRKNLASTSSSLKSVPESQNGVPNKVGPSEKPAESSRKGLFVKINMDGVPIGRKVDLKAYDSYEKLSIAVDELFRGLLAAQRDSSAGGIENMQEEEKPITGVLDGTGEYTLVYEDNEGDRMLVGDVPWHMFVSTVKRLRVLKSSELSVLTLGNKQHKMVALDSAQ